MKKTQSIQIDYKIILISRKPLQYFPDDYNGSISSLDNRRTKRRDSKMEYRLL